ncbi:hypothetical protein Goari_025899, partial [Gossypium aridum]|nr:hypothetical protein [Gossypium aridum]
SRIASLLLTIPEISLSSAFVPRPYVHYSRHLHAMRRRFLNKKSLNSDKEGMEMKKAAGG